MTKTEAIKALRRSKAALKAHMTAQRGPVLGANDLNTKIMSGIEFILTYKTDAKLNQLIVDEVERDIGRVLWA